MNYGARQRKNRTAKKERHGKGAFAVHLVWPHGKGATTATSRTFAVQRLFAVRLAVSLPSFLLCCALLSFFAVRCIVAVRRN
jgi:hypothetical protein